MKRIIAGLIAGLVIATCLPVSYAVAQEEEVSVTVCQTPRGKLYGIPNARQTECGPKDTIYVWNAPIVLDLEKPEHLYDNGGYANGGQDLGILKDTALYSDEWTYATSPASNKYKTYLPELEAFLSFGYEHIDAGQQGNMAGSQIVAGEKAVILFTGPSCNGDPFSVYANAELARTVYRSGNGRFYVSTGEPLLEMACLSSRDITTGNCVDCPADSSGLALPLVQITLPFNANQIIWPLAPGTPGAPIIAP